MKKSAKETKNNKEQINHQSPGKDTTGLKKIKNKEILKLKNTIRPNINITMTTNGRNQNRQTQRPLKTEKKTLYSGSARVVLRDGDARTGLLWLRIATGCELL